MPWFFLTLFMASSAAAKEAPPPLTTADLAPAMMATTIYIETERTKAVSTGMQQLYRDYELPTPGEPEYANAGSGFLINDSGLALTNHHVVDGASMIRITLHNGRQTVATLVGSDPRTDVALLQIAGEGPFHPATLGDSDALRLGETVISVGHPFDFTFSLSQGVVSAVGRRSISSHEIQDYIQTDAAVNPGSSGGPLFNGLGEVIGINTAIFSPNDGAVQYAGISFAIPINMAQRVASALSEGGPVPRGSLGLVTRDGAPHPSRPWPGAEITRVMAHGPAEAAGLRRGDVVLWANQHPIRHTHDLRSLVLARGPGIPLDLRILRGDGTLVLAVTVGDGTALGAPDVTLPAEAESWAGMHLLPATPDAAVAMGVAPLDSDPPGLLILAVDPNSPAASAGLIPGDILIELNRTRITDMDHLRDLQSSRGTATATIWRSGGTTSAVLAGLPQN